MTRSRWPVALVLVALLALPCGAAGSSHVVRPVAHLTAVAPSEMGPPHTSAVSRAYRPTHSAALRSMRRAAENRARARERQSQRIGPRAAVFGGLNQLGLIASDNSLANLGTPPDTTGAIGPSNYVEFVNTVIRVYDRGLTPLSTMQGDSFVDFPGDEVFDIQIQWDQSAGRWLYLTDVITASEQGLAFGWSKTASPLPLGGAGWCRFGVPSGGGGLLFDDYPKLGHDDNHILVGSNLFVGNDVDATTGRIFSIPMPPNGQTTCPSPASVDVTAFSDETNPLRTSDGNVAFTPVPANTADAAAAGFIVSADDPTDTPSGPRHQVMVWHMAGGPTSPTLVANGNVEVSSYNVPPLVPQPGGAFPLDSLDARLTQAVAHADPDAGGAEAVWTQHTVEGAGRSVVRWYELIPSTLSLRQEGTVSDPANFAFNAAISPAETGRDAAIHYNVGGSTLAAQIRAQSRDGGTPLGQMRSETLLASSAAPAVDGSCGNPTPDVPCRWGDYAGASPDPANPALVWGSNQFIGPTPLDSSLPAWRTQNFALLPNAAPTAVLGVPRRITTRAPATFTAAGSTDDGSIVDYQWDLNGDGTFETNTGGTPTVSHRFAARGRVNVGLRVVDGGGVTGDARATVNVRDRTKPKVRLRFKRVQNLLAVLRHGVKGTARCNERCRMTFQLALAGRTARSFHITRTVTVGKKTVRLRAKKTKRVAIKLSKRARSGLRPARRVTITMRVRAKDTAGNARNLRRHIVLKR